MTAALGEPHIGLVVEGPGDAAALPILLRMHMHSTDDYRDALGKPVPVHGRGNATVPGGLEGFVTIAAVRPGCRAVLVVLDGEGDCVAELGPALRSRLTIRNTPLAVALADKSYEEWLSCSVETLDIGAVSYTADVGASSIQELLRPRKYVKPTWQPRLTARMDLPLASSRNKSLARMLARFDELRQHLP